MTHIRFNIFSVINFLFTSTIIVVVMYLSGILSEFDIIDILFPFGIGIGLLFFRPIPSISEKTCTHLHWRSDIQAVVWGTIFLFLWVSIFGNNDDKGTHSFYVYLIFATGLLLFKKLLLVRVIYVLLGDQFEPKCGTCNPAKYTETSSMEEDDDC